MRRRGVKAGRGLSWEDVPLFDWGETPAGSVRIALAGNPNTGKSTLFNAITGARVHVGNWPGKTVERREGSLRFGGRDLTVVDLPGIYSLNPSSEEGTIAREYLLAGEADALVIVVDVTSLEHNLYLVLQLLTVHPRCIVALNMMDVADRRGWEVDIRGLNRELGVPVVPVSAVRGEGVDRLLAIAVAMASHHKARQGPALRMAEAPVEVARLYRRAGTLARRAVRPGPAGAARGDPSPAIDRVVMGRWTAFPVLLLILSAVFWITLYGATPLSSALSTFFSAAAGGLRAVLEAAAAPPILTGLLVDGLVVGVGAVVSVMLPTMAIFFILFALLEDAGFVPRFAFVMDRLMRPVGSEGRHCLTCMVAYGCNIPGVMAARIMSGRRRLIAILTNSLNPCNGRLGPMLALAALLFGAGAVPLMVGLILLSLMVVLAASLILSRTILKGEGGAFIMELPAYRAPSWGRIARVLRERVWTTLWRAVVVAAPATLVIWLAANLPFDAGAGGTLAARLSSALDPAGALIGLPGGSPAALLFALPAKEIVLASLAITAGVGSDLAGSQALDAYLHARWTPLESIAFLTFYMLYMPCLYTAVTIQRETRNWRWTAVGVLLPLVLATGVTSLIYWGGRALQVFPLGL